MEHMNTAWRIAVMALLTANLIATIAAQPKPPATAATASEPTSEPKVVDCWRETTTRYPTDTDPVMDGVETASRTSAQLDSNGAVTGAGDHVTVCRTQDGRIIYL